MAAERRIEARFAERGCSKRRPAAATSTGFVIDDDGLILTNNNVIENAIRIQVQFLSHTVTVGVISALARAAAANTPGRTNEICYRPTRRSTPGNSPAGRC